MSPTNHIKKTPIIAAHLFNERDYGLLQDTLTDVNVLHAIQFVLPEQLDLMICDIRQLHGWLKTLQAKRKETRTYLPVLALIPFELKNKVDLIQLAAQVDEWLYLPLQPDELKARVHVLLRMSANSPRQQAQTLASLYSSEKHYRDVNLLAADYCYSMYLNNGKLCVDWESGNDKFILTNKALPITEGWLSLLDKSAADICLTQYTLALDGQASEREFLITLPTQKRPCWVNHRVAPIKDDSGVKGLFAAVRDIDKNIKETQELLMLRHAAQQSPHPIIVWQNNVHTPIYNNDAATTLLEHHETAQALQKAALAVNTTQTTIKQFYHLNQQAFEFTITKINQNKHQPSLTLISGRNITEQLEHEKQLAHAASHDALTGLPNRSLFLSLCNQILHQNKQEAIHVLALIEFSHLRTINESLGHEVGDKILCLGVKILKEQLPQHAVLARIGGNEFAVMVTMTDELAINSCANHMLNRLMAPVNLNGIMVHLEPNIGISLSPNDGEEVELLLRNAESALNEGHSQGGIRFSYFQPAMNDKAKRKLQLEAELRQALVNNEFCLHYQLQVPKNKQLGFSVEALLRWQHPIKGLLSPAYFIDVLEHSSLMYQTGLWVLETACLQWLAWKAQGIAVPQIAVNVAAAQLLNPHFATDVIQILERCGLPAHAIELELTESAVMKDLNLGQQMLNTLADNGVQLALDDFGTGHSSLAYLAALPFHRLKIDRSFIAPLPTNPIVSELVRTMLLMAKGLDLHTVAEGIEIPEQAQFLKEQGCDWLQGYYFSKPCPPELIPKLLATTHLDD
ncbi:TPA: EAL domain-containing protein [Vibrio cholerae]|jgi:diguanylate cyclase (GGDEF)-like protein